MRKNRQMVVWGMEKEGGQWEVEDEEGGHNGRGKQGEIRWQVVEEKDRGEMKRRDEETAGDGQG